MRCGEYVVAALAANGVETVFGIPGTHTLELHGALARSPIRHVAVRHEQGAGFAADGYARAGGAPGVCLVTTGPGLTNVMTAAANAHHDSIPMLIISPGMPRGLEGGDAGFLHQVKDQSGAMSDLVNWSRRVADHDDLERILRRAFVDFRTGRPRPVHVEIPLDILEGQVELAPPRQAEVEVASFDDETNLSAAIDLLRAARDPWLLIGGGATEARQAAAQLAERAGAVVVTTMNGRGIVPESHPLSVGASLRLEACRSRLERADVVVAVGTEIAESELWQDRLGLGGELIRIDLDEAQLEKNAKPTVPLLGRADQVLPQLVAGLPEAPRVDPGAICRAAAARTAIRAQAAVDGTIFAGLFEGLSRTLSEDAIVTGDSAQVCYYGAAHQLRVERPRTYLYPGGYAPLGYALPAAIGAKLARPERQVVALSGDGGFLFTANELVTAAELGLPLPVIVYANGGYGQIRREMIERGFEPLGVDLDVDHIGIARAMGCEAIAVRPEAGAVGAAVGDALGRSGPTLIEIHGQVVTG